MAAALFLNSPASPAQVLALQGSSASGNSAFNEEQISFQEREMVVRK